MSQNPQIKRLFIGTDHAGLGLKEWLQKERPRLPWEDHGCFNTERVDFPDFADKVAQAIVDTTDFGVLICGSGQGMAIRANRYPHIRAALCWTPEVARLSREHNNANVLCLGQRLISPDMALKILDDFLNTGFAEGRHTCRVEKLSRPMIP